MIKLADLRCDEIAATRSQAKPSDVYYLGRICIHGHEPPIRFIKSSECVQCGRLRNAKWRAENSDHLAQYRKAYWQNNSEALMEKHRAWIAANREHRNEWDRKRHKRRRIENPEHVRQIARAYVERNKEKVLTYHRASYQRHRAASLLARKLWAQRNPDKVRAIWTRWRLANLAKANEATRKWAASHPEHKRAIVATRRARIKQAPGRYTVADIRKLKVTQNGRCAHPWCRVALRKFHVDHIQPLALGGSNYPSNLQLLCAPCNQSKSASDPVQFAQKNGWLL